MLEDIFCESIITQDFIAQGLEQGHQQGFEQGRAAVRADLLLETVRRRFPRLLALAEQHRDNLIHRADFLDIWFDLMAASNELQACQVLLDIRTNNA